MPIVKKSERLGLSFPYDWSSADIGDAALISHVLERGIYGDICRVCAHYGLDAVNLVWQESTFCADDNPSLTRMMNNIQKGFRRAQS